MPTETEAMLEFVKAARRGELKGASRGEQIAARLLDAVLPFVLVDELDSSLRTGFCALLESLASDCWLDFLTAEGLPRPAPADVVDFVAMLRDRAIPYKEPARRLQGEPGALCNLDRVKRALKALRAYVGDETPEENEYFDELLADGMHFAYAAGLDFDTRLARAREIYAKEHAEVE